MLASDAAIDRVKEPSIVHAYRAFCEKIFLFMIFRSFTEIKRLEGVFRPFEENGLHKDDGFMVRVNNFS